MSKEGWTADFAAAVAGAVSPKSFVPQGDAGAFVAGAPFAVPVTEEAFGRLLEARRQSFAPQPAAWTRPAASDGFTPGFAGAPAAPFVAPAVAEPVIEIVEEIVPEVIEPPVPQFDEAEVYAAGFAEGERVAREAYEASTDACAKMIAGLAGATGFDRAALSERLRNTVLALVQQVVGECGVSPALLSQRIDRAIGMLADVTEPARLFLHPDDLAMLDGSLPGNVASVGDEKMSRGSFRLETLTAEVEDGPAMWLDQLTAALDTVALPE
ncbi:FliH/SctL family protein [Sphingomonas sp. ID0503]|uniref:FliH/SctL family protein n=1 Tax=Sphingomonas sp. ID0503 TaxID=3399691 RepID=UPI003AFB26F2